MSNVTAESVQGFDEEDNEIETVFENGTAKFTRKPTTLNYKYDTLSRLSQTYREQYNKDEYLKPFQL